MNWTNLDDLSLLERAERKLALSSDQELKSRTESLSPEMSALINSCDFDFNLISTRDSLSGHGNTALIRHENGNLTTIVGKEVREKLELKQSLGMTGSTLQRIMNCWALFAAYLQNTHDQSMNFILDFSDFAQYPGPCVCFSSNRSRDFLVPDPFFLSSRGYASIRQLFKARPNWGDKFPVLFWRGSTTGKGALRQTDRFLYLSDLVQRGDDLKLDIGFASVTRKQADSAAEVSALMKSPVPKETFSHYRYLLDIDGNSNSWGGLFSALLTGSLVIKCESTKGFRQWYYPRLKHLENYFLLESQLTNWNDLLSFLENDKYAKQVAQNGLLLANELTITHEIETTKADFYTWMETTDHVVPEGYA